MRFFVFAICLVCTAVSTAHGSSSTSFMPALRMDFSLHNIRANEQQTAIAFTDEDGKNLRLLDLKSRNVFLISRHKVGHSYFWAPNGFRLVYREMTRPSKNNTSKIQSVVKVYDTKLKSNVEVGRIDGPSGHLSFDPRDHRFYLLHNDGILSRRLLYPDERFSRWQVAQKTRDGRWIVSLTEIIWLSHDGLSMGAVGPDNSGIQSFDLSPDASTMVWSTKSGRIYTSKKGQKPRYIGEGRNVRWHPAKPMILCTSPRKIGSKIANWDLAIVDSLGNKVFLTETPLSDEESAEWLSAGSEKIIFTVSKSTDLFVMELKPNPMSRISKL